MPARQHVQQRQRIKRSTAQPDLSPSGTRPLFAAEKDVDATAERVAVDQNGRLWQQVGQQSRQRGGAGAAATGQDAEYGMSIHARQCTADGGPESLVPAGICGQLARLWTADPKAVAGYPPSVARTAAFFDLDKTIIAKSSTLAFGKPFFQGGLINRRAVVRSAYAQFVFALAGADEDQMDRMRDYLTAMCTGWDVQQIRDIVTETLHEIIDPLVYDEAVELIAKHKEAGRDVIIISSSGDEVVRPIGEMVGADEVIATRMVVRTASTPARSSSTPTARTRRPGCSELAADAATTWPSATPTPTRSPTCRCWRRSGTPTRSIRTEALRKVAARARLADACLHQRGAAARTTVRTQAATAGHHGRVGRYRRRLGRAGLVHQRVPPRARTS